MNIAHWYFFFNRKERMMPIPSAAIMPPKVPSSVLTHPGIIDAKSPCADAKVIDVNTSIAGINLHTNPIACPKTTFGINIFFVAPSFAYLRNNFV